MIAGNSKNDLGFHFSSSAFNSFPFGCQQIVGKVCHRPTAKNAVQPAVFVHYLWHLVWKRRCKKVIGMRVVPQGSCMRLESFLDESKDLDDASLKDWL